jgi:predicted RNase H-like nuclease (RuvC/YqgF family)
MTTKNEEIKAAKLDQRIKEKALNNILDRLSRKDQEIGRLTDELHNSKLIIENLRNDVDRLRNTGLLERISIRDQEIGNLTHEFRNITLIVEDLKRTIDTFKNTDLLEQLSLKEREIGKLTDKLHNTQSTIENLTTDIGRLREIDIQVEEKKRAVGSPIDEKNSTNPLDVAAETAVETTNNQISK